MMGWLLKLLGGSLGPYLMGAVGVLLAGSMATAAVQGWRLDHAKKDLKVARAALVDPATKRKWKDLAVEREVDLGQCRENERKQGLAIEKQNKAVRGLEAQGKVREAAAARAAEDARQARALADKRARQLAGYQSAATCPEREAAISTLVEGLTR